MKRVKTANTSDRSRKDEQNAVQEMERETTCPGSHNTWVFAIGIELKLPKSVQ